MKTNYRKYVNYLERWFPLIWFIISITILISIVFSIQFLKPDTFKVGWNYLVTILKVPLSFLVIGIPIYGIILALKRIYQTEDQLKLFAQNIHLNNYYKHMEEFIKTIIYFRDSYEPTISIGDDLFDNKEKYNDFKERLTSDFLRRLYIKWYGNDFKSNYKIKIDIHNSIKDLYQNIEQYYKSNQNSSYEMRIIDLIVKLGFKPIFIESGFLFDEVHWIFRVCERALEFSNQSVDESKEVRKLLGDN